VDIKLVVDVLDKI